MSKRVILVVAAAIGAMCFATCAGGVGLWLLLRPKTVEPTYVPVSFQALTDEWKANPAAASRKYETTGVKFTAVLLEVSSNLSHQTYIEVAATKDGDFDKKAHVFVLSETALKELESCRVGSPVTISGRSSTGNIDSRPWLVADHVRPQGVERVEAQENRDKGQTSVAQKQRDDRARSNPERAKADNAVKDYAFGEEIQEGVLQITVVECFPEAFSGHYYGKWGIIRMTMAKIRVRNTSDGKLGDWPGWNGKGSMKDEHGNVFKPVDLTGWTLPRPVAGAQWDSWEAYRDYHRRAFGAGITTDEGIRVEPGKTYVGAAYFEYMPDSSKQVTIALPLAGRTVRFRGLIGQKDGLDHAEALKAKQGVVLDAADYFRQYDNEWERIRAEARKGTLRVAYVSAMNAFHDKMAREFPVGSTMRVTGLVKSFSKRSDLNKPYMIGLVFDANLVERQGQNAQVWCESADTRLYEKLTKGKRVTLQGILLRAGQRSDVAPDRPLQIEMRKCVEVEGQAAKEQADREKARHEAEEAKAKRGAEAAKAKREADEQKAKRDAAERAALRAKGPAALGAMLAEKQPEARRKAAVALGELGAEAKTAAKELTAAVADPDAGVRGAALDTLGRIGAAAKESAPAIIQALKDPDPGVRRRAVVALEKIGPGEDATAPLLAAMLDKDDEVSAGAGRLLQTSAKLEHEHISALSGVLKKGSAGARKCAIDMLVKLGAEWPSAVKAIGQTLADKDSPVRQEAIAGLGKLGPKSWSMTLDLAKLLDDEDVKTRRAAVVALGKIGPSAGKSTPNLIAVLTSPELHDDAAAALVRIGRGAVSGIIDALADANDFKTRRDLVGLLGKIGPDAEDAIKPLESMLTEARLPGTKAAIKSALIKIRRKKK